MKKVVSGLVSTVMAATMILSSAYFGDTNNIDIVQLPFVSTAYAAESQVTITNASGWLETAWVEWTPTSTSGVSYYQVSYAASGSSTYTAIDDELIRMYSDGHRRADIIGLKTGTYNVKVEAFDSKGASLASETTSVTVTSHNRTGFTFSSESTNYDSSDPTQCGGYNGDGTPKTNADIIYITSADDIDTVTYEGYTGLSTILQNRHKQSGNPLIVRLIGKIDYSGSQLNSSGYIQVKPSKTYYDIATTIEGVGSDTTINFGFLLRNAGNVEVRNLAVHDFADDGISLDTANSNIWIHNNELFYGVEGSGDKAKGDGSTDVKNDSQYVTISYNHYWDGGKVSLCGMKSETGDNYITYHHNWFDHSDSRHPRIRTMFVHVYNNYYDGNAKYGVGASENSNAFVEGNYFRNCKYPTLQGSVGMDSDGSGGSNTLDDDNPIGAIKMWNNYITGANSSWGMDSSTTSSGDGDAYNASSRAESISYTTSAGATYRNIDVSNAYIQSLASSVEKPATAKTNVETYAGRVGGGDFALATGFEFTDSTDDTSYAINSTLRTALTNYSDDTLSSNYVISSIGGSVDGSTVAATTTTETTTSQDGSTETTTTTTTSSAGEEETETTTEAEVDENGYIWNYTDGTNTNNFLTVSASDWSSASSNPITYGSYTLTKAKKFETETYFTFTAPSDGKLILVTYSTANSPAVKVNDTAYTVSSSGATTISVSAGTVTVTKSTASTYLYYLQYIPGDTTSGDDGGDTPTTVTGDVNQDGYVTTADSTLVMNYLTGAGTLTEDQLEIADVDESGTVTIIDAMKIRSLAFNK